MNNDPRIENRKSKIENEAPNTDSALWRELEALGEQDEHDEPEGPLHVTWTSAQIPEGFRLHLPSGIAHDFMREDIHNKLADDAFKEGRAAGIEQERATHGHDLIFAALVSAFAGFLLAAVMTWALK